MKKILVVFIALINLFQVTPVANAEMIKTSVNVIRAPQLITNPYEDPVSSLDAPTIVGNKIYFHATAKSSEPTSYYLAICKTDAAKETTGDVPVCVGGAWCISALTGDGKLSGCNYQADYDTAQAVNEWYAFACSPSTGVCSRSSQGSGSSGSPFYLAATLGAESVGNKDLSIGGLSGGKIPATFDIDIKSINAIIDKQENSLTANLTLMNSSTETKSTDKVVLIISELNGENVETQSLIKSEKLAAGGGKLLSLSFPEHLAPGSYIGTFNLYFQKQLVGSSKTVITVNRNDPEVLGAKTSAMKTSWPNIILIFVPFILSLTLIIKRPSVIQKGQDILLLDPIAILVTSILFGSGLFTGYFVFDIFTPFGSMKNLPGMGFLTLAFLLMAFILTVIFSFLIKKQSSLLERKYNLKIINLLELIVFVYIFLLSILGGFYLSRYIFALGILSTDSKSVVQSGKAVNGSFKTGDTYDFIYRGKEVSVLDKPDSTAMVVEKITKNTSFKVIDQTAGWYRIALENGKNGWVVIKSLE